MPYQGAWPSEPRGSGHRNSLPNGRNGQKLNYLTNETDDRKPEVYIFWKDVNWRKCTLRDEQFNRPHRTEMKTQFNAAKFKNFKFTTDTDVRKNKLTIVRRQTTMAMTIEIICFYKLHLNRYTHANCICHPHDSTCQMPDECMWSETNWS